jgi:hypothetical protein
VVALAGTTAECGEPIEDEVVQSFLRDYRARLPALLERYSTNRKIRYRLTEYVVDSATGRAIDRVASRSVKELITDGTQIRVVPVEEERGGRGGIHRFWRQDVHFMVIPRDSGGFDLMVQGRRVHAMASIHEAARYGYFAHEPIRAGGYGVATASWLEEYGPYDALVAVVDVRKSVRRGEPCLAVRTRWDDRNGIVEESMTYLDPGNDFITIGTETDWRYEPLSDQRRKLIDEIEYRPSMEGFPLPKSSRRTLHFEDGSKQRVHEVEFLSYERYVPAQGEFQLEGRYGLSTPSVSPNTDQFEPEAPAETPDPVERFALGKSRKWIVLAAVLGLVIAVALLIWQTTRRPARP